MQILYWHLVHHPSRRSCLSSPPVLQRRPSSLTLDAHPILSSDMDMGTVDDVDGVVPPNNNGDIMEFDENGLPTIFYLNVENFDELGMVQQTDDMDVDSFTHHYRVGEDGILEYHQNGLPPTPAPPSVDYINTATPPEDPLADQQFEFEEITTMPTTITETNGSYQHHTSSTATNHNTITHFSQNQGYTITNSSNLNFVTAPSPSSSSTGGNKRKTSTRSSISFDGGGGSDDEEHANDNYNGYSGSSPYDSNNIPTTTKKSSKSSHKRPKLVINLYEESLGYEFGCSEEDLSFSHLIPYSEDSLLRAVDREEIPTDILSSSFLAPLHYNRGHLLAQIRDFRQFPIPKPSSLPHTPASKRKTPLLAATTNANSFRAKNNNSSLTASLIESYKSQDPVVREVLLRPSSGTILQDFDLLVQKSLMDRRRWKLKQLKSNSNQNNGFRMKGSSTSNSDNDEESDDDSEFEFEADLETSIKDEGDFLSYDQRLELEKELVNRTSGPLCLDPNPVVSLIQNRVQFERLKWHGVKPSGSRSRRLNSNIKESTSLSAIQVGEEDDSTTPRGLTTNFTKFIASVKDKITPLVKELEPLKLPGLHCWEYPPIDPPSSLEEILKICPRPSPSQIRVFPPDNYVKKIEEYILETERRKRPHVTKLSIYQRNGMDCYFGELEMDSILEAGPLAGNNKPGVGVGTTNNTGGGPGGKDQTANTKCQFELGSSRSVALYVKQFSDIFTEDGRRPCKITYQKAGQPTPQVLYTNSYKAQQQQQQSVTTSSTISSPTASTVTSTTVSVPTAASSPPVSLPSQPPVQIVHPQPRTQQPSDFQNQVASQVQGTSQPVASVISPSVNFNVNVNPTPTQQLLTRPQIVSVNLQGAAQKTTTATAPTASQQAAQHQILQQRLLQMKQRHHQQHTQQNQQQQNPQNTALAKLLLANIQQNNSGSRPITVAVQPQPQKLELQQSPQTLMLSTSSQQNVSAGQNLNLQIANASSPSLSVNVNTMMLDSLLNQQQQQNSSIVTTGGGGHHRPPVNILRVNATQNQNSGQQIAIGGPPNVSGASPGTPGATRQYTMNTNLSQLLSNSSSVGGSQRILINANNGQQITLNAPSSHHHPIQGSNGDHEGELSVPDLNLSSLLNSSVPVTPSSVGGGGGGGGDTHNLNLNLNVNLNSGSVIDSSGNHQIQGHAQAPPFLVFISPLRQVPVSINQQQQAQSVQVRAGSLLQQQLNASINLGGGCQDSLSSGGIGMNPNMIAVSSSSSHQNLGEIAISGDNSDLSIFNALNEAIGPDLSKLEHSLTPSASTPATIIPDNPTHTPITSSPNTNTVMIGSTSYSVNVSSSSSSTDIKKDPNIITLSDLLGSTSTSNSSLGNSTLSSLILQSPTQPQHQQVIVSSNSNNVSRLSALLAGTPSADSSTLGQRLTLSSSPNQSNISSSSSELNSNRTLLDRLKASLTSPTTATSNATGQRSGGSGLNPIASATPNVVLEHPVLAATLTGGQQSPKVVSAYRQIAPAPTASSPRGKPQ